jgi:hypothetical protein
LLESSISIGRRKALILNLPAAKSDMWRSLDQRPDHLGGLEAAVLGTRLAGRGPVRGLPFLPLALTVFGARMASEVTEHGSLGVRAAKI